MSTTKPDESREQRHASYEAEHGDVRYVVAPITQVDVRDTTGNGDDTWTMSGYAAVFNQETTLYDGKFLKVTEHIDPQFFDAVLREQPMAEPSGVVHFNLGHDMNRSVAATDVSAGQPGWLNLKADTAGLNFLAKVARDDPDGIAMASKMRTGVLRQASFAFTIAKAEWTTIETDDGPDEDHRTLLSAAHLYDVCACPQGAYPQTTSQLRSYAAAIGQLAGGEGHAHQPDSARGASTISVSVTGGRGDDELAIARARAQARARLARHHHPGARS
jgi:HK97 family phage prohead protease